MTRRVADVMVKSGESVREDMPFKQVARSLVEEDVSALPVVDVDGRVVGVVSEADLILRDESFGVPGLPGWTRRSIREKLHASTARELMTAPAVTVKPETDLAEAARLMRKHAIKRAPVCDADGRLLGIVSRRDLLLEFTRTDDEIADEIDALWRDLSLPSNDPRFVVEDGVATIEGRLERRSQAKEIVLRVHEVPGIVDVRDRLTWDDPDDVFAQGATMWVR